MVWSITHILVIHVTDESLKRWLIQTFAKTSECTSAVILLWLNRPASCFGSKEAGVW